ncbi:hypothetical protein FQN54_000064 [Arachnomyces sp. PD_36]|nr:hypothetical protein FQN54_000064 [Arachnomyces sp. PD_36]
MRPIDVGLLYEIITRAEREADAEQHPFRTIFKAYHAVLAEHRMEVHKDQIYLRFLFKLGDKSLRGKPLYERFEILLWHLGIKLELDDDDQPAGPETGIANHIDGAETRENTTYGPSEEEDSTGRGRWRRASFNSMYDVENRTTQRSFGRPSSRSSVSRLQDEEDVFTDTRPLLSPGPRKRTRSLERNRPSAPFSDEGRRLTTDEPPNNYQHEPGKLNPSRTASKKLLDGQLHANGGDSNKGTRQPIRKTSGGRVNGILARPKDHQEIEEMQPREEVVALPHLLRDASAYKAYRQRIAFQHVLTQWSEKAKHIRQTRENHYAIAVNHDSITLVRQAFDLWKSALHRKLQVARTERFFKHLENRAARARDLYLLTKAFAHWAQVTSDEIAKTSAARQHILRVKFFNAWREITAVNELKAQRLALKLPFKTWRKRFLQLPQDDAVAVELYQGNLAKRVYWKWFWSFCDRRVPQWRDSRLKWRSLICWLRALRTQRERDQEIDSRSRREMLQSAFQSWSQRSRAIRTAQQQADTMHKTKLLTGNVQEWKMHHRLAPIYTQVSSMVDWRIVRSANDVWVLRTRMARRAQEFNRLRILRDAWTTWNDRLRSEILVARIDERLVMQTLYKWVLASRSRLMTRIHEQRIKYEMLSNFVVNSRDLDSRLLQQEKDFKAHQARELLRAKFNFWRRQLAVQQQRENTAMEFYAPGVLQNSIPVWRGRTENVTKLEHWARDARFYFLMMHSVKQWHASTVISSKRRRQDAYARIRRQVKVNIASETLATWRSRAAHVAELERQADEMLHAKNSRLCADLFNRWRQATENRLQGCRDADIYYNRQLAYHYLARWVGPFNSIRIQDANADKFIDIHIAGVAAAQLRKLSLRVFQVRNSFETADAMKERILRKHLRNMLRHWVDRTRAIQEARPAAQPELAVPQDAGELNPAEAEGWPALENAFDVSELVPAPDLFQTSSFATPTPGYLKSPSKRASRARAIAQMSTTPATPIRTPFASRLRAQISTGRLESSMKSTNKRNSVAANVRFADIEEQESPSAGRRSANKKS